ncbi:MAG: hypothetical protein COA78_26550 [Blastopirellula sp.]|nr:MAG: hypothetical protein COA78_26550 [Blastopirellula sp.]
MEARKTLIAFVAMTVSLCAILECQAASFRSENFVASASDPELARQVIQLAEQYRKELALKWLGHELPAWSQPCPITVNEGGGAGGATSFTFYNRVPMNWIMEIQGSRERILDSVLPHEILHTVFATHFGRPLPRWADEGACTTVEDVSERNKNTDMLYEFLTTDRGIAFNRMFAMKEYPADVLPLYAQGYSLSRFLIAQGGERKFVDFVGTGMDTNNWTNSMYEHYGFRSLGDLQVSWLSWVRGGSDPAKIQQAADVLLASHQEPAGSKNIMRGQSPDAPNSEKSSPVTQPNRLPQTLSGPLVPVNLATENNGTIKSHAPQTGAPYTRPLGDFYANGGQAPATASNTQPVTTSTVTESIEPDNLPSTNSNNQSLGEPVRTSRAAPAFYLPGGTSLYR